MFLSLKFSHPAQRSAEHTRNGNGASQVTEKRAHLKQEKCDTKQRAACNNNNNNALFCMMSLTAIGQGEANIIMHFSCFCLPLCVISQTVTENVSSSMRCKMYMRKVFGCIMLQNKRLKFDRVEINKRKENG